VGEDSICAFPVDPDRCGQPLLDITGVRDVMGRLRSVTSRFGYPRWSLPNFDPLPTNQPYEWCGYGYDRRSFFTREWAATSASEPDTSTIVGNMATNAQVDATGNALAAEPWDRERELNVGGLVEIRNANDRCVLPPR